MFSVKELRSLAKRLTLADFRRQLGPFALIQRPTGEIPPGTLIMGLPRNVQVTRAVKQDAISRGALGLLFEFDNLVVTGLPPLQGVDALSVGRQPDNDLVLDDPSVSKKHATLRWDGKNSRCSLLDLGSTNGTFLNASSRLRNETILKDGDIVSFGEVQYWFLLTPTFYTRLTTEDATRGA